jgi:hypothetical protein
MTQLPVVVVRINAGPSHLRTTLMNLSQSTSPLSFSTPRRRTTSKHRGGLALLLILPSLVAGCGKDYETVPVSGRVTLDGAPLADVGITFVPLAENKQTPNIGPGSLGKTDEEGRFTLRTTEGDKGAVPTEHIVRMSMAVLAGGQKVETTLPRRRDRANRRFLEMQRMARYDFQCPLKARIKRNSI